MGEAMLIDIKNEIKNTKRLKQIDDYTFSQVFDFNVIDSYYDSATKMINKDMSMFLQKSNIYNVNIQISIDMINANYESFKKTVRKYLSLESTKRNTIQMRELSLKYKMNQTLNAAAIMLMYCGDFTQALHYFDLNYKLNDDTISKSFLDRKDEINEDIFRYNMALDLISLEAYDDSIAILSELYSKNWRTEKGDILLILLYNNRKDYLNGKKVLSSIQSLCKNSMFYYEINGELTKANKNKLIVIGVLSIVIILGAFYTFRIYGDKSVEKLEVNNKTEVQDQATRSNSQSNNEIKETSKDNQQKQVLTIKDYSGVLDSLEKNLNEENLSAFAKENSNIKYEELGDRDRKRYDELYSVYKVKMQSYYYNKGREYFKKKDYKESTKYFTYAYNNNNGEYLDEHVVFMLGQSLENMKDASALKYYEEYIDKYKTGTYVGETLYSMSLLYYDNKNLEEAKRYAKQLAENHGDSMYYNQKIKAVLQAQY
jgi:tetratricopeptide (TPR) repeat protein